MRPSSSSNTRRPVTLPARVSASDSPSSRPTPTKTHPPARIDEKIIYYEPLWNRFIIAAIVLFLLDLLVRRVRLFDRKFLPKRGRGGPFSLRPGPSPSSAPYSRRVIAR
jgi:hypothetical protein